MSENNGASKISMRPSPIVTLSISNPTNVKQVFDNMTTDLSLIISYMDLAVKECAEKNMQLAEDKDKIINLTKLAKKYNSEAILLDSKLHKYQNNVSLIEHDVLKFKNALDGVIEITSDLPNNETSQIKLILEESFMKKTRELEKTVEELKLFKKNKDVKDQKTSNLQISLSKMEIAFENQTSNINTHCENVEQTTLRIAQTYSNFMSKANDMLQLSVGITQNKETFDNLSNREFHEQQVKTETSKKVYSAIALTTN